MSDRHDRVMEHARQVVGEGPEWMGGKFGDLVRKVAVGIALFIIVVGGAYRLIHGPNKHARANSSANSAADEKPKGGF